MTERPKAGAVNIGEPELDAFLRDLEAFSESDDANAQLSPGQLAAALSSDQPPTPAPVPASELRARLMAALPDSGRFERFADAVSQLLDVDRPRAQHLLDQLDNRSLFAEMMPGIELFWVEGGPRVANAVRGFVRVAAGLDFPEHEHFGEEQVLVLQGSFRDPSSDRIFRPGDISVMPKGSSHLHFVPLDGPDLLMLSVIQTGVAVGEQKFWPNEVPTKYV
jgi:quercetin dioxygenase-like cupin family protein